MNYKDDEDDYEYDFDDDVDDFDHEEEDDEGLYPLRRKRHPTYARRTFSLSVFLFGGGIACLLVGLSLRGTRYSDWGRLLEMAFAAAAVGLLVYWFVLGETTVCPQCGRRLRADPDRDRNESLKFPCTDCRIEWDTGGLHDM